ncbi:toll/interleukin-1 receptor domain-containing protein [Sphingosinicella sp. LHD-64]|uniref:toll/interleukin-1 receptor domain-containing protein n=1 Tax=Sphingosinicella sp. LHD-64 TaxID=3072139 RepID=UPI00280D4462|nr:toll/interleukin-1 receptor domain-containing protein [Sphingosinicella sp. LHD-64]MDQ8758278.1 toll/interleukin-1 receptor domain-containing protein [Sphingosinicella sp. LHD-64]
MSDVFFSYKREDRGRVAPLVAALRAAGIDTWWDQDIPAGGHWRETIAERIAAAKLGVVAWSHGSTGADGRYVREEAELAASRSAYLGVLIDKVPPPFGFGGWQAVDLAGFSGRDDDPLIPWFVDQVRARLEGGTPQAAPPRRRTRPRRTGLWIGGLAALLLAVAGIAFGLGWIRLEEDPVTRTPTDFVNARTEALECGWVQIGSVRPSEGGERIFLSGIAAAPDALQALLMREAETAQVPLAAVDVADVAVAPPEICAELQLLRPYRWEDRPRLTVIPPRGALSQTRYGWTGRFEFELNFDALPPQAALLGLDSEGGVEVLVPDLHAFRRQAPPLRTRGPVAAYEGYFFDENRDARNVGLILMTARRPIDVVAVGAIGAQSSREDYRRLQAAAEAGGWQFELALVRCGFEAGAERQC